MMPQAVNSSSSQPLPASLGYQMPPEWHRHESTWLVWPKNRTTWPDQLPQIQETYLRLLALLTPNERVDLLVDNAETEKAIRQRLGLTDEVADRVLFHQIKTVDSWIRDYGPNFLLRETKETMKLAFNHWKFNAWGNRYKDLKKDAVIPERLEPILDVPRFTPELVLEGGSIDVNGQGMCLTTEQCLLDPNRNPSKSKSEIEQYLKDYLGILQILWLSNGIVGDDTDGHLDNVARFVNPRTIACSLEEDPSDENYQRLQENYRRLQEARDVNGCPFEIVPLPMPGPLNTQQERLPASYANFYIANGLVLLPAFSDLNDRRAAKILQKLFPDRKVIGVDSRTIVWGRGALHCLTLQQPASL
ncbi:agmatine deiminase family protein [Acidobacteria bacterium AH-259-D05]|nr:agmatine deiminase family protein [Acidobacteria bacterium AH-259-D05]